MAAADRITSLIKAGFTKRKARALVVGTTIADPAAITSVAAPAGGTGAAAGGWDTAQHRDDAITSINANRTDIAAVRTALVNLADELRAQGIIS
jgi:O-acetyl-ADP-ribose deacetylase (regulator of RNase III)